MTPRTGGFTGQPSCVHCIDSAWNRRSDSRTIKIGAPSRPAMGVMIVAPSRSSEATSNVASKSRGFRCSTEQPSAAAATNPTNSRRVCNDDLLAADEYRGHALRVPTNLDPRDFLLRREVDYRHVVGATVADERALSVRRERDPV